MPTRRIPIGRTRKRVFTPEILAAFRHLVEIFETSDCTCPPIDWEGKYWERGPICAGCLAYDEAESELVGLLDLKPWERLENPHMESPYPPDSPAAKAKPDESTQQGIALWHRLEKAAAEEDE